MKQSKEEKKMLAKEALKAIDELEKTVQMEDIVKDNKIEFEVGKNLYRLRLPTNRENRLIDEARRKKYTEIIADDSYLFRKEWIKKYKNKGIDIKKMDSDIKTYQGEIEKLMLRLAKTEDTKSIGTLKDEILKVRDERNQIITEKTDLLSYSIEDSLAIYSISYTCYIVLEKKTDDKWAKYFETYEKFDDSTNAELVNKASYYINRLLFG